MAQIIATTAKGPIEYRLEGSGSTVVVLNGGHGSRETRLSHEKFTEYGFSVLTPSRPGYDGTPSEVGTSAQAAADALVALLDTLQIATVDVIGISAAGPAALAFVQQHPSRVRKLILESAVTTDWDEQTKRRSRIPFGGAAKPTWAVMHGMLQLVPTVIIKALLHDLTVLDVNMVFQRTGPDDLAFVERMLQTSQASTGFVNDIEHKIESLSTITKPVLVMYSPNDRTVSSKNARRVASEITNCELYGVPSDTHLTWIGNSAKDVWQKRLSFAVGPKIFKVDAADNAGNTNSASASYSVIYSFDGFFSPVDNQPTLNIAKAGQTIPLKWRITDAGGLPVTNLISVTAVSLACEQRTTIDQ